MQPFTHLRDEELMLAIDGELDLPRAREVEAHLAHCWSCRLRRGELERSIEQYMRLRAEEPATVIPPSDGPAARLRAEISQFAAMPVRFSPASLRSRLGRYALAASMAAAALFVGFVWITEQRAAAGPLPDARLTPGATRLISEREVCVLAPDDDARRVPVELAHRVFEQYHIAAPRPRAFEVDYLISPTLGGADDIRNLWPQPYAEGEWTSRVKDALEDHLRRMVCAGTISLAEAQQDIATNWIAAYKKHFRTERPLAAHALFVKDRPWE